MKRYIILGSHPGDGGVVFANSPWQAAVKFFASTSGESQKKVDAEMKKTIKDYPLKKVSIGYYVIGDYEIKEAGKLGIKFYVR